MVILEEVSNQAPWHLARLSKLCQSVTGSDEPFGGVLVLLIGDLTQLGPVKAIDLTCAVMDTNLDPDLRSHVSKHKQHALGQASIIKSDRPEYEKYLANHPHSIGSNLLTSSRWFELTQQQRSEDSIHTNLVTRNYHGEQLTFADLKNNGYKILSSADANNPDWIKAPILVSTNRERHTLTHTRAIQFARSTGTVVIRWRTHQTKWLQKPLLPCHQKEALEDPCFYEYFVAGASAFLTENIQKHLKLTNATSAIYHSLVFNTGEDQELLSSLHTANAGDIITLSQRPLAVNVEIQMSHDIAPKHIRSILRKSSLRTTITYTPRKKKHTTFLLPIWSYPCKTDKTPTTVRGGKGFPPSKATLKLHFPIEPAFAITVHKSEGRTIDRVIIALSSSGAKGCNFTYAQVHVAFSRVRHQEHIRLLLTGNNEVEQWRSLLYLGKLRPKPSIAYFFNGFRRITDYNHPNDGWQHNGWNKQKPNTFYRQQHNNT